MLRVVVVPQLVLSLLVGPMLCCCTFAQLGHGFASINRGPARSTSESRTCCGAVEPSHPDDSSNSHEESPGSKPRCPCKAGQTEDVGIAAQEISPTDAGLVISFFDDLDILVAFSLLGLSLLPLDGAVPDLDRPARTAFTSTAELLYAHHRLRC